MSKRQYIVTSDYIRPVNGQHRQVISERIGDGPWQVFLDVLSDDAVDVLNALRRAYEAGRDDLLQEMA